MGDGFSNNAGRAMSLSSRKKQWPMIERFKMDQIYQVKERLDLPLP